MRYSEPPFELGTKMTGVDDNSKPTNLHLLGQVYLLPAQRVTGGPRAAKGRHTGKGITAVILRNISGTTLHSKQICRLAYGVAGASTVTVGSNTWNETNYAAMEGVDGRTATLAEKRPVIVDPFLASGVTVADNEIFWGILKGRCVVTTGFAGAAFNGDIAVGGELVAATASTSQVSTAGRVSNVTFNATTAWLDQEMSRNLIGYALSARTTGETNADILIDACINY